MSKLTMKTPEWWRRSGDFIGSFEDIWVIDLVFPLLIFEQVIARWEDLGVTIYLYCNKVTLLLVYPVLKK